MRSKKILMVGPRLDVKGGITSVVNSFLNNDFKKEFEILYVPTFISGNNIQKIIYFIFAMLKILSILIFFNISIIHIHFSERGSFSRKYFIFKIGKLFRKRIIVHMHGAEFREFYEKATVKRKKAITSFLKGADKVIVLGTYWYNYVKGLNNKINTVILRNSIKVRNEEVSFDENKINIVFLGILTRRKGIFDLIESARILLQDKELKNKDIIFIIAGEGQEETKIKKRINDLNLNKNFKFLGWINEVEKEKILKESQILILPSYNEGLPISILEGMSYGLPIVTTDVGDICDAVKDDINGYIIKSGDIRGIYYGIKKLIISKSRWNGFSKNSKRIILENYDERNYFIKIKELYKDLC